VDSSFLSNFICWCSYSTKTIAVDYPIPS